MTVSGWPMRSAVRHPVQMLDSSIQSQRSAFESRNRRSRVRCTTGSWCRNASTSSWSTARERALPRKVRSNQRMTDIIVEERIDDPRQRQPLQQERTRQPAQASYGARSGLGTIWSILTDDAAGRMCS